MSARGTGERWAEMLWELEENVRNHHPDRPADRCGCLQTEPPQECDTDMQGKSHLVVPGGQVESNRSRH
ncbi:MAG TPA: hypothetical protein VN517_07235 [Terriglobales bacterium]|nr:hypothetical protein [Terriglobales bacterium]